MPGSGVHTETMRGAALPDRPTIPQLTARRIMREASRRELVPGDRLASEPALMGFFCVSRGSLREALRTLEFLGAIQTRPGPGGGTRISTPQPRVVGSALAMALQFRGATLRTVLEARAGVEPQVAGSAAMSRKDQDLAAIDACLARLGGALSADGFQRESDHFHRLVAAAAGNEVLSLLVSALTWISTAVEWQHAPATRQRLLQEKATVADAIRARDPREATARTAEMFRQALEDLERHQPQQLAARILWADVDELLYPPDGPGKEPKEVQTWTR